MKRLICAIFGHDYYVRRRFTAEIRQVGCKRCHRLWGMHDGVKALVPWDGELEALHTDIQEVAKR